MKPGKERVGGRLLIVALALLQLAGCRRSENAQQLVARLRAEARLGLPSGASVVELYDPDLFIDPMWAAKVAKSACKQRGA